MREKPKSLSVGQFPESESWKESRSGAWAARGFHYQHLVSALILVRQWAGLAPPGTLVPEGFDDCVLESADRRVWIQIKSRRDAPFRKAEVRDMLDAIDTRAAKLPDGPDIRSAVVLERPCAGVAEADIGKVLSDDPGQVFICRTPDEEVVRLLLAQLDVADVIARGLANDLYKLVADASADNASLSFDERRRISTTEVDRSIFERLEAEDPTVIDHALLSGVLEPVDFATPVHEPDFYRGIKVKPGHVTAKLVLDRPNDVRRVLDALRQRRQVLVSGPSGAGKSALVWLATAAAVGHMRWYQVTGIATAADADAIVRFVRARSPRDLSPLGLIFDEVGSSNSDLWDVLAREMTGLPAVYLLGSVRQEDVYLIANQSDTAFVRIALDEALAQSVWERLSRQRFTSWTHWREPFEPIRGPDAGVCPPPNPGTAPRRSYRGSNSPEGTAEPR